MQKSASAAEHAQASVPLLLSLKSKRLKFKKQQIFIKAEICCFKNLSMAKNISSSIRKYFVSAGKFVLLIAVCIFAGIIIVWPLWRFATAAPVLYTITVISLFTVLAVYRTIRAVHSSPWKSAVRVFLHFIIIAGGLTAAVVLVFEGYRFFSIPVIILIPVLYIISSRLLTRF